MNILHHRKNLYRFSLVAFLGMGLLACSSDDDNDTVEATYSSLWTHVFEGCGLNCHNPNVADGTENGPDMSTKSSFYQNLVRKNVMNDFPNWGLSGTCQNINFIEPGDANMSTVAASLVESVSNALSGTCINAYTIHVPLRAQITDSTTQNALIMWINSGAKNN